MSPLAPSFDDSYARKSARVGYHPHPPHSGDCARATMIAVTWRCPSVSWRIFAPNAVLVVAAFVVWAMSIHACRAGEYS